jgi:predicted RNase H-like nuclease (RuvC/YqgF family)
MNEIEHLEEKLDAMEAERDELRRKLDTIKTLCHPPVWGDLVEAQGGLALTSKRLDAIRAIVEKGAPEK